RAFCTGSCKADTDCPIAMECQTDYDGIKKCLPRTFCSACTINEHCSSAFPVCVPDTGSGHYCTKVRGTDDDCGGAQGKVQVCRGGTDSLGTLGTFCFHRYGACVGTGQLCDPCRTNADCAASASSCYSNDATHESFCSKMCNSDAEC